MGAMVVVKCRDDEMERIQVAVLVFKHGARDGKDELHAFWGVWS